MAKLWDNEDSVSEYELIAEDAEKAEELAEEYSNEPNVVEAEEEQLEEIAEESTFDLSHSESNTIFNARLRLEQAKLYEMLINHNLFEGVDDVSPQAIKNVQNELKFYVVKRLEILLGLRDAGPRSSNIAATVELPFNDIEIDFLKQLAHKGTFGKSENGESVSAVAKPQAIRPVSSPAQKLKALQTKKVEKQAVAAPTPAPKAQAPTQKAPPPAAKRPAAAPPQKAPVAKAAAKPKIRESGMGRTLTAAEAEEIARADLKTASAKPFHEMTAKEKAAKIREVGERNKRPATVPNAAPMPNPDQIKMKYMTQQESQSYSKNQTNQFNTILASALAAKKNRGDDDGE